MGLGNLFRGIGRGGAAAQEVEGSIVEHAVVTALDKETAPQHLVFRLDARRDLEFRQELTPLTPVRRRGDRVRVHYHADGMGQALVDWVEAT